jgi:hypothetical protein
MALAGALALLWLGAAPGSAEEQRLPDGREAPDLATLPEDAEAAPKGRARHPLHVRLESLFVPHSDFGSAEASFYEPSGELRLSAPLGERTAARLVVEGAALFSDWDGDTDLFDLGPSGGDAFDTLVSGGLKLQGQRFLGGPGWLAEDERWSLLGEARIAADLEEGAEFDEAITGGGSLGIGYELPDRLDVLLGAGLQTRLDRDGPGVMPVVSITWWPIPPLRLRAYTHGVRIDYDVSEKLRLFARMRLQSKRYRLETRPGPTGQGTLRERRLPVGLGVLWKHSEGLEVGLFGGVVAWHQLRAYDSDRDRIDSESADPAPLFELRIDWRGP